MRSFPVIPSSQARQPVYFLIGCCALAFAAAVTAFVSGCNESSLGPPAPSSKWVVFTEANSPLLANAINCLALDGDGRVWMGTDSGASAYFQGSWMSLTDSLTWIENNGDTAWTHRRVTSIAVGKDRTIWFGLAGGGVKRWNRFATTSPWQSFGAPDISSNVVACVAADRYQSGDVWVGTYFGLSRFVQSPIDPTQGKWEQYAIPPLPSLQVLSISVDFSNGSTYIGTANGLAFIDVSSAWHQIQFAVAYQYPVGSIAFDLSGFVWLGKWRGMTSIKNNFLITEYTSQSTGGHLPSGPVNAVATDLFSDRWFGTNYGLVELMDTTWSNYTAQTSPLPSNVVTALLYDRMGNLWIGTTGGVAVYNPKGTIL